jgi:hypothetical protein
MTVLLNQAYSGYPAGQICEFPASTEAAMIAQGIAVNSTAVPTTGAATANAMKGSCAIAAGASSVVITNPYVTISSFVMAVVAQTTADTTLLRVERVVPANGSFTIFGTANATATTRIDWCVINNSPTTPD